MKGVQEPSFLRRGQATWAWDGMANYVYPATAVQPERKAVLLASIAREIWVCFALGSIFTATLIRLALMGRSLSHTHGGRARRYGLVGHTGIPSPIFLLGAYFTRRHRVQDGCTILPCLICGFHVHIEQLLYRSICNITICNYLYSRVRCVDQRSRPALSPEPQLPISETRSVVRSAAVMVAASLGLGASSSSEQARETSICLVKEI